MLVRSLCILVCGGLFTVVVGQSHSQSVDLMTDMLSGYDRRHRPVEDQSKAIQVNVSFDIVALQDFDEVEEKFSVVGILYITWTDEKIRWNPADYGGIITQMYQLSDVWYPVLILANPYESIKDVGSKWMTVRIYANGFAVYAPGAVFEATCSVDVTYYPFDTQHCFLLYIPWGYTGEEMNILSTRNDVLMSYFSPNGEWTITSTRASAEGNILRLEFDLKRKPLFLVINVLLPIIFTAFINLFTFLLPAESGERISYAVTCLLAIAIFLTLVSDNLPKTSEPMSIMCYYLMIVLIIATIICLATILNLKVYFADEKKPVPSWCKKLVYIMSCKCMKKPANDVSNIVHPFDKDENKMDKMPKAEPMKQETDDQDISWRDVSYAIDRVLILTFTIVLIVITGVFMSILANGKQ